MHRPNWVALERMTLDYLGYVHFVDALDVRHTLAPMSTTAVTSSLCQMIAVALLVDVAFADGAAANSSVRLMLVSLTCPDSWTVAWDYMSLANSWMALALPVLHSRYMVDMVRQHCEMLSKIKRSIG